VRAWTSSSAFLDHIDKGLADVVFFATRAARGRSASIDQRVARVFKVLSATANPEEYARRITTLISRHHHYRRDQMLAIARRNATPPQRKALSAME